MVTVTVTDAPVEHTDPEPWEEFVHDQRIGVDYDYELIPFGDLFVDYHESVLDEYELPDGAKASAYQRRQDKYARKMRKEGFRPDLFGALIVNKRNGIYAVVDGGTRFRYLESVGLPDDVKVPCLVFKWDNHREIGNYIALNRERSGLTQVDFFIARAKFGDDDAVAIEKTLIEQTGQGVHSRKGGWQAVNAIETAYRRGNLAETMAIIRQAGWLDKPRGRTQAIIAAVSRIVAEDNFSQERALAMWKGVTPAELYGMSKEMLHAGGELAQSRSLARLVGIALIHRYNKALRKPGSRLDPTIFIPQLHTEDDDVDE
jgi:hypothetical protein